MWGDGARDHPRRATGGRARHRRDLQRRHRRAPSDVRDAPAHAGGDRRLVRARPGLSRRRGSRRPRRRLRARDSLLRPPVLRRGRRAHRVRRRRGPRPGPGPAPARRARGRVRAPRALQAEEPHLHHQRTEPRRASRGRVRGGRRQAPPRAPRRGVEGLRAGRAASGRSGRRPTGPMTSAVAAGHHPGQQTSGYPCSRTPRPSAASRSTTSKPPSSSTARPSAWRGARPTGCSPSTSRATPRPSSTRVPATSRRSTRSSTSRSTTSTRPSTRSPSAACASSATTAWSRTRRASCEPAAHTSPGSPTRPATSSRCSRSGDDAGRDRRRRARLRRAAAALVRGARARPRQVPRRADRLRRLLARRDADGLRVLQGGARGAGGVRASEVPHAHGRRPALQLGHRPAGRDRPRGDARAGLRRVAVGRAQEARGRLRRALLRRRALAGPRGVAHRSRPARRRGGVPADASAGTPPLPPFRSLPDGAGVVLGAVGQLLTVLLALLAHGVGGRLRGRLGHLLAALERLLAGLLGLLLDPVGHRAELLVLDAGARDEHAEEEAGRGRAHGQAERVLLSDAGGLAHLALDLLGVRSDVARLLTGDAEALLDGVDLARHVVLGARFHVGLVAERIDGLPHALAGVRYFVADRVRVFAHCTSSFTESIACSGTGGAASWICLRPVRARTAAMAAKITVTIRAASHVAMARSRAAIRHAVSAPAARRPTSAAAPSMPAPLPRRLPRSVISALARSISWRTRVLVSPARSLTSSPIDWSRGSATWPCPSALMGRTRGRAAGPPASSARKA